MGFGPDSIENFFDADIFVHIKSDACGPGVKIFESQFQLEPFFNTLISMLKLWAPQEFGEKSQNIRGRIPTEFLLARFIFVLLWHFEAGVFIFIIFVFMSISMSLRLFLSEMECPFRLGLFPAF